MLGTAGLVAFGLLWWWVWPRTDWVRRTDFVLPQPVPFSHEHHVAGLGINCLMCHNTVRECGEGRLAADAYLHDLPQPDLDQCRAAGAGARELCRQHSRSSWNRVYNLPDYVYFNHSIHVAKGVGCQTCHGQVDRMPLM